MRRGMASTGSEKKRASAWKVHRSLVGGRSFHARLRRRGMRVTRMLERVRPGGLAARPEVVPFPPHFRSNELVCGGPDLVVDYCHYQQKLQAQRPEDDQLGAI